MSAHQQGSDGATRVAYILGVPLGRLYRNVTIGELDDGEAVRVTDYWGEPTSTPEWRVPMTGRLDMPAGGTWPANTQLSHH
jgi:hypothetical protein